MILLLSEISLIKAQGSSRDLWKDIAESSAKNSAGKQLIYAKSFRMLSLDIENMRTIVKSSPIESSRAITESNVTISLPFPDGSSHEFYVNESPVMAPELITEFPDIRTFSVVSKDYAGGNGRIDVTQFGFHAMLFTPNGTIYIDPYLFFNNQYYMSYYFRDFVPVGKGSNFGSCVVDSPERRLEIERILSQKDYTPKIGNQLRTYRLALAADSAYTAYCGGTVEGAYSQMVTTMNRVNGVYINDLCIKMVMVANTRSIIFTNNDPYTNDDGNAMLSRNQTICDNIIGSENYDIGHVFSTGGGGVAGLGVVCLTGQKAMGVTGSSNPVGDGYDIDYVAHEMGHQFGADHTFNSETDNCGGGNRTASSAYENGGGTTIMAYAGICGSDDLQPHSDPYFHTVSINEIVAYTNMGSGNSCAVTTSTGNSAPILMMPVSGYTIPINTPFSLTASASDPDGDALTYCWEEYDLGDAGSVNAPSGNAPIFRSLTPTVSPTRYFPKLSSIIGNTTTYGEMLPTYARTLTFRCTARDNKAGGGGVTNSGSVAYSVSASAGPFLVTAPNATVWWGSSSQQTVTWNVANTNTSPVNCSNVNILLSTDGGQTWRYTLAANTPNDGTEIVTIPNITTTNARVMVQSVGNIFFDISNTNFTIAASTTENCNYSLASGWNMVAVPLASPNMTASSIFTGANSLVFGYSNGYTIQSTLDVGKGYWVRYPDAASFILSGANVSGSPITLDAGWNMIGLFNTNIPVANITTTPAGIINSSFFGFGTGYVPVTTLNSGIGYWVKTSGAGTLNIGTAPAKAGSIAVSLIDKSWNKIIVTDKTGNSAILYAAKTTVNTSSFELPPVPPLGIFDVRFASQSLVENLGDASSKTISISGAAYPVEIRAEGTDLLIKDNATGKLINNIVKSGSSIVIANENINTIEVSAISKPAEYQLEQNYPNPFNPSTTIRFALPENAKVRLTVFNQIGEQVAELVNGQVEAGYHQVIWNAANLNSGVYFYEIRAEKFSSVKKLLFIK